MKNVPSYITIKSVVRDNKYNHNRLFRYLTKLSQNSLLLNTYLSKISQPLDFYSIVENQSYDFYLSEILTISNIS